MPVLPPSPAAFTRLGSIIASAPNMQSTMRKPVNPRAAQAAGSTALPIVPGGQITSIARNTPSLLGMACGNTDRIAQYDAALVNESVLLIAPLTCGLVPVQSACMAPPLLRIVTRSRIGLPQALPAAW